MSFRDIIGQDHAISILQGAMARSRIASAYLFAGEDGVGKRLTALNFAKALNCLSRSETAGLFAAPGTSENPDTGDEYEACDHCDSCLRFDSGTHPDLIRITPDRGMIKIGQIRYREGSADEEGTPFRPLEDVLKFSAYEAVRRIVLVEEADRMNEEAANAFLKTLEEPPADTVIILITSRPDRLLATIRSRCTQVNFKTLSKDLCRQVLRSSIPPEELEAAVRLAMGRPGIVLGQDLLEERQWFFSLLKDMLRGEKDGWASREEMERWFDHAAVLLRDLAVQAITSDRNALANGDHADELARLGKRTDLRGIITLYDKFLGLKRLLLFNLNKSITWNYTAAVLRKGLSA